MQLEALSAQHWTDSWEVIISDNGSRDDTLKVVEHFRDKLPNVKIVDASFKKGSSYARNIGAKKASGKYLVFVDSDDEVGPGWLTAIGEALLKYDFVASRVDLKKLNPRWIWEAYEPIQIDGLQKLWFPPYFTHAATCGLGIKKSIHEEVGGFDETLMRLVDTDYCIRVRLTETKLHFVQNAVVHYRCREGFRENFNQARLWGMYFMLLYKKYRSKDSNYTLPWKNYIVYFLRLSIKFPKIFFKEKRTAYARRLGSTLGKLQGILKYRIPLD